VDRRRFLLTSLAATAAAPLAVEAQQAKIARLGVLLFGTPDTDAFPAIRRGLDALGYVEGRNILFEHRYAEGRPERLPDLASDLVRSKPDLIIAAGGDVAPFAKRATGTIPIVMITSADPVQGGLVASLARPGGNVTGVTFVSSDLAGKRLQFLKETAPGGSRFSGTRTILTVSSRRRWLRADRWECRFNRCAGARRLRRRLCGRDPGTDGGRYRGFLEADDTEPGPDTGPCWPEPFATRVRLWPMGGGGWPPELRARS
jgi:hypothetical protein